MATKIKVVVSSSGEGGNIFAILANVSRAMRSAGKSDEFKALQSKVFSSGSYEDAIALIRESVDLVDTDGEI